MNAAKVILFCLVLSLGMVRGQAADDIVFADFEGATYGAWQTEGTAFGPGPAQGGLPGQWPVDGFQGHGLASSFHGGDDARGRLISPEFQISRRWIAFLIGGGGYAGKTCLNLVVNGKIVRTATGPNIDPGGSERLARDAWDVDGLKDKTAHLEMVDDAQGGWGHVSVDQIVFTDARPILPPKLRRNVAQDMVATDHWLLFPIRNGAEMRHVTLRANGKLVRQLDVELADGLADWLAPLDIREWSGQTLSVMVDRLPENSEAFDHLTQSNQLPDAAQLYREPLRPQFHFSARRGWLNDPNGLVFFRGEYHLFFQHSPFSWDSADKWWGHAVSRDLVHWTELGDVLAPDERGSIWSGSAVVDAQNTSGLGRQGQPPLVLVYTAAGNPFTQCLASSVDGRTFAKFAGNPVVPNITDGDRDPRVFWHAPTRRWVMALWAGRDGRNAIQFLSSPNLRDWTATGRAEGGAAGDSFLYECPDLYELFLDGDKSKPKWILSAANGEYEVGWFDGKTFTPESTKLHGAWGRGFYAPQTFNDAPQGRRIQIGWFRTDTPGMPFNQSMSLPLELHLVTTANGPRLTWEPVKELETLRRASHKRGPFTLGQNDANPLADLKAELVELRAEFAPDRAASITFTVRGVPVIYEARSQEIVVNGRRAPAPLLGDGQQRLTIYADRTGLEVFAAGGLTFVPLPLNLNPNDTSLRVSVQNGAARFRSLDVYELRSAWNGTAAAAAP
ncbi:MAG: glycoside hydrolase family 32 protein [Armatimonadota bacterium]|nr:glycoside hydrolase family 32 protein [Armatimonadota bacterium]